MFIQAFTVHLLQAIDLNRTVIARLVGGLFALLGLTAGSVPPRIPREVHRAILRVLRPAESAVRRLILVVSRTIGVQASPSRPMPKNIIRSGQGTPKPTFQLFDPRPPLRLQGAQKATARSQPRISFFGDGEARTVSWGRERPRAGNGQEEADENAVTTNSASLVRRLQALTAALEDIPRQARRLARALARRRKSPRLKLKGVLRPGRAPGYRRRPIEEIDSVLHQCDWLARETLPPNTS